MATNKAHLSFIHGLVVCLKAESNATFRVVQSRQKRGECSACGVQRLALWALNWSLPQRKKKTWKCNGAQVHANTLTYDLLRELRFVCQSCHTMVLLNITSRIFPNIIFGNFLFPRVCRECVASSNPLLQSMPECFGSETALAPLHCRGTLSGCAGRQRELVKWEWVNACEPSK